MTQIFETHMFWAYGNLSNVEIMAANSFLKNGYHLKLWTYGGAANAPEGVEVRDARRIIPESQFFLTATGSPSPFSDFFRYAVLNLLGGLWADTDVIALKPLNQSTSQPFLVTERTPIIGIKKLAKKMIFRKASFSVNNNIIFNPIPSRGNIIDLAFVYSERFPREKIGWSQLGPELLSSIERIYPDHGFEIKQPEFANSIDYWDCPSKFFKVGAKINTHAYFIHLYNETWRNARIDKNGSFPKGTLIAALSDEYL